MGTPGFRSVKGGALKRALGVTLGYVEDSSRGKGSHSVLTCEGRVILYFGFGNRDLAPHEVKRFLMKQANLTLSEALEVMDHV
jgi:hypothetical protein